MKSTQYRKCDTPVRVLVYEGVILKQISAQRVEATWWTKNRASRTPRSRNVL